MPTMTTDEIFTTDAPLSRSRFRLRRTGRDEWLDDHANPTDDPTRATDFAGPIDAVVFATHHTDEPHLWHWEMFLAPVR